MVMKLEKCSKFYYQTPFIDAQTSDGVSEFLEIIYVAQFVRPAFIVICWVLALCNHYNRCSEQQQQQQHQYLALVQVQGLEQFHLAPPLFGQLRYQG
jgi:hypothetical protein